MLRFRITRTLILLALSFLSARGAAIAQPARPTAQLKFVVILSRHGVRSPTGKASRYDRYSRAAWPKWNVQPGYLTPHGFALMKLFGTYDRSLLASDGLLTSSGCADASLVSVVADSDQRTRQSGLALAEGMFPGCPPPVHALPQGSRDPLFHPEPGQFTDAAAQSPGAAAGRLAGEQSLTEEYRPQIARMDRILATCGRPSSPDRQRVSLFDVAFSPRTGRPLHPGELQGPLSVAATLSENFLLEYTQDMPMNEVGWGCVSKPVLRSLLVLHTAAFNYEHRNPAAARMAASNLLAHIRAAMRQAVEGRPVPDAPDSAGDRVLFLIGHDTNLAAVAALLNLNWVADGRRDDTPPGSALVFELWRSRATGRYFVRTFFTAQTLDQMRYAVVLTLSKPPLRVPLAMGGCSKAGSETCSWTAFSHLSVRVIDAACVDPGEDRKSSGIRPALPQSGSRRQ